MSVIEKGKENSKDKKKERKIAGGRGRLEVCLDWQKKEKHWQHILLCAGGHANMSLFVLTMEREMKRVRRTERQDVGGGVDVGLL